MAEALPCRPVSPDGSLPCSRTSEREHEVLSNLAKGSSYSAIADTMCVAADTVRFHIRNIYRKLHVHSQTAAVAKAIREDLI